jgi:hypothetical protein
MIIIGAVLVLAACFVVMFEVVINERQSLLFTLVAALVLFLIFGVPILGTLWQARRNRA